MVGLLSLPVALARYSSHNNENVIIYILSGGQNIGIYSFSEVSGEIDTKTILWIIEIWGRIYLHRYRKDDTLSRAMLSAFVNFAAQILPIPYLLTCKQLYE